SPDLRISNVTIASAVDEGKRRPGGGRALNVCGYDTATRDARVETASRLAGVDGYGDPTRPVRLVYRVARPRGRYRRFRRKTREEAGERCSERGLFEMNRAIKTLTLPKTLRGLCQNCATSRPAIYGIINRAARRRRRLAADASALASRS